MVSGIAARLAMAGRTLGSQVARRLLKPQGLRRVGRAAWRPATLRAIARVQPWRGPTLPLALRAAEPGYGEGAQAAVWRVARPSPWPAAVTDMEGGPDAWAPAFPASDSLVREARERVHSPQAGEVHAPESELRRDVRRAASGPLLRAAPGMPKMRPALSRPPIQARAEAALPTPVGPAPAAAPAPPSPSVPADQARPPVPTVPPPTLPAESSVRAPAALPQPASRPIIERRPPIAAAWRLPLVSRAPLTAHAPLMATGPRPAPGGGAAPSSRPPAVPVRPEPGAQARPAAAAGPVTYALTGEPGEAAALPPAPGVAGNAVQAAGQPRTSAARMRAGRPAGTSGWRPPLATAPLRLSEPTMVSPAQPAQLALTKAQAPQAAPKGADADRGFRDVQEQPAPRAPLAQLRPARSLPPVFSSPIPEVDAVTGLPAGSAAGTVQARHELPLARPPAPYREGPTQAGQQPAGAVPAEEAASPALPPIDVMVQRAPDEVAAAAAAGATGAPAGAGVPAAQASGQEGSAAPAVDLDAMARQVYDILRRRLRVERERSYGRST